MRDLLRQKIVDSLAAAPPEMTARDIRVPAVRGKAVAVIGPRRAGKTTFLWQVVFLLDEIQSVNGWEKFARRLQDSEQVELYLSGSSARLLSREVATSMRGRAMEALVLPFSFREFLRHRGLEPAGGTNRLSKSRRSELDAQLRSYLSDGGFPEAQGIDRLAPDRVDQ